MTQRTTNPLPFTSTPRRPIHADFSGGGITSDAGALLLREADRNLGLIDALDRAIPDPRRPELITHPQRTVLAQRIFGLAAGYEDLNDHQHLRNDPPWQVLTDHPGPDHAPALASPPTPCRLENRITRRTLVRMAAVLVDHVHRVGRLGTALEQAEARTIRSTLFKIGGWVQKTVRRVVIRMSSGYPWAELFERVVRQLTARRSGAIPCG